VSKLHGPRSNFAHHPRQRRSILASPSPAPAGCPPRLVCPAEFPRARIARAKNVRRLDEIFTAWGIEIRHAGASSPDEPARYCNSSIDPAVWGPFGLVTKPHEHAIIDDFLNLSGDFYWLSETTPPRYQFVNDEEAHITRTLPRLLAQATQLGVVMSDSSSSMTCSDEQVPALSLLAAGISTLTATGRAACSTVYPPPPTSPTTGRRLRRTCSSPLWTVP
jgi:hypothetical protein